MKKPGSYFLVIIMLVWSAFPAAACAVGRAFPADPETPRPVTGLLADSVITVVASEKYQRSKFFQLFWGRHYRKVWATPVQVPVLDIQREAGGLTPIKKGGSFQTMNLRLQNPEGYEYVIRSIDKNPVKALPERLQKTFLANLMQDQTSVIHPYGALIVPTLANAAGVYHTNPKLIIVPDDPGLGEFRKDFAGLLAIIEERPDGDQSEISSFGHSVKVMGSRKALKSKINGACVQVDSRQFLKSRLFDMWLGDWSRREDQWRWASFDNEGLTVLQAIPRDRDHAFFKFNDGIFTWLGSKIKTNFQTFGPAIRNLKGLNKSALPLDETLLTYLTREDFRHIADSLKQALTDETIGKATGVWPEQIYALTGKSFEKNLKQRREQLPAVADKFFKILNKEVLLAGTDKGERFEIERLNNQETKITVYAISKKNCPGLKIGERVFRRSETKSINVYGLGGDDVFVIKGEVARGIKINIFDGEGEDIVEDESAVKSLARKLWIMDNADGNTIKAGRRTRVKKNYKPRADEFSGEGWLLRHRLH